MTKPTSAKSLVGYPVAHFGHLLTFESLNFTWKAIGLEQIVNSEGKSILELFTKELKLH